LRVEHADEAAQAFDDVALHQYTGGSPASAEQLRSRYERQVVAGATGERQRRRSLLTSTTGRPAPFVSGEVSLVP
jgi:hypothetical protein